MVRQSPMTVELSPAPLAAQGPPPLPGEAARGPAGEPLSAHDLRELEQAEARARKVRKAGRLAVFNGITFGFFAACSALFALVSPLFGEIDTVAAVMAVGFGLVACNELKGRRLLRRFDPRAPRLLGWNQVCLMLLLIGYCTWQIGKAYWGPNPYAEVIEREPLAAQTLGPIGDLYLVLTMAVYGGVAAGTLIFQGLNALYYFRRGTHLRAYLEETPPWVVEVQRRSAGS